jgi:hypothetical protein
LKLVVESSGDRWAVPFDNRTFAYSCAAEGDTEVVAASAVFADGRRASASVVTDARGHSTGESVESVAVTVDSAELDPCVALASSSELVLRTDLRQGFEVAFVLDPSADYRALAGLGQPSVADGGSWQDIASAFSGGDELWFVSPDNRLAREDGFSQGREAWFGSFFEKGLRQVSGPVRIAEAVAVAGLTVAADPHRRAVVLVLGPGTESPAGRITAAQARSYLAEIGVPLHVIRTSGSKGDGWPEGAEVHSIGELARVFEDIRRSIDWQCVAWHPEGWRLGEIAALLPSDTVIAGRGAVASQAAGSVWRRAGVATRPVINGPITDQPVARERVEVTAVSVLVRTRDAKGRPVTDLSAADLTVTEDDRPVPILGVEPLPQSRVIEGDPLAPTGAVTEEAPPTRKIVPVAIYVERGLAGTDDLVPALSALAERAEWLTSLGPVDIVVADESVEPYLEGADDAAEVRDALAALAALPSNRHAIERIRTEYVRYIREYPERGRARDGGEAVSAAPSNILRVRTMTVARSAIFEEDALLTGTMARMNDWALGLPSSGPRLLFLVGTGFDEDPIDFYLYFLQSKDPSFAAAARAEFLRYNQATRVDSVGRELAAAGWMVVPVATRVAGRMRTAAEFGGGERFQAFLTDSQEEGAYLRDVDFMLLDPLGSQRHLSEPSGGKVVIGGRGLDELINESSGWYRLTYQVDRAPDGAMHKVAVIANRPDVEVESTGVVVSGTSEGRAAMRLRVLLEDPSAKGELPVRLAVGEARSGDEGSIMAGLTVTVDFGPISPLFEESGRRVLRFSVGVRAGTGVPSISHQLATAVGAIAGMRYEIPIQWTKKDLSQVVVIVEDLGSGAWGGEVVELRTAP